MKIKINNETEALKYLYQYIPDGKVFKFPGDVGLKRTKCLLKILGNPQDRLKVIHIAGTSGKGSVSYLISRILRSLGFKVGLSVSPHLLDIRERFQINNRLLNKQKFYRYLSEITPAISNTSITKYGTPTYFEVIEVLAYYIFYKEKVDYAVIETGLGGTFDATNVVNQKDKLAVITRIGHDHTNILGKTLDKIASQKAGIIHPHNVVVTVNQNPTAMQTIRQIAKEKKSKLYIVDKKNTKEISLIPNPRFDFKYLGSMLQNIKLMMLGSFQIQNCSLALATTIILSQRDKFTFAQTKVKAALKKSLFPGRMQKLIMNGQRLIIDGAHNPQKMSMFTKNLKLYYPNHKFVFIIALKKGKDYKNILKYIVPLAKKIIISSFFNQTESQGFSTLAEEVGEISKILKQLNFKRYCIYKDSMDALRVLQRHKKEIGVITGSLYLIGEIYPLVKKSL